MARDVPVVFFVFNRPDEARLVFQAIRSRRPRRLHVVSDGAREHVVGEADLVSRSRSLTEEVDWPCEVTTDFAPENMGCGRRLSSGITAAFERFEEAIFLEDDCLPGADFFFFTEVLLERYRDDPRVGMIGGTRYPLDVEVGAYAFSSYTHIWGWASWRSRWEAYDFEMTGWRDRGVLTGHYRHAGLAKYMDYEFSRVAAKRIDTWDLQWAHACAERGLLCGIPPVNLVENIGLTGAHTSDDPGWTGMTTGRLSPGFPALPPPKIQSDERYDAALYETCLRPSPLAALKMAFARRWRRRARAFYRDRRG